MGEDAPLVPEEMEELRRAWVASMVTVGLAAVLAAMIAEVVELRQGFLGGVAARETVEVAAVFDTGVVEVELRHVFLDGVAAGMAALRGAVGFVDVVVLGFFDEVEAEVGEEEEV